MLTQALRLERANRPAQVKQWWQSQVNWGENQQEIEAQERQQEAQRQLRREAEEQKQEQQAQEAERTTAEAAKLKPPEKAVPIPASQVIRQSSGLAMPKTQPANWPKLSLPE
jgi:hypothetical protein